MFKTSIPVLVNHLNYGNHLGYDSVLSIMQEARMRWLKTENMNELSIEGAVGFVVTEVQVRYKSEAFYGDILSVELSVDNFRKKSFDINYEVKNENTGAVVATAKTSHVFFDHQQRKVASIPTKFQSLTEETITSKLD